MEANDPRDMTNLDPRGMVSKIYVGDNFREEYFLIFFSIISLWELMTPWGVASLGPRCLIGRIYVGDQ